MSDIVIPVFAPSEDGTHHPLSQSSMATLAAHPQQPTHLHHHYPSSISIATPTTASGGASARGLSSSPPTSPSSEIAEAIGHILLGWIARNQEQQDLIAQQEGGGMVAPALNPSSGTQHPSSGPIATGCRFLDIFALAAPPPIDLPSYCRRLQQFTHIAEETMVVALVYLRQICDTTSGGIKHRHTDGARCPLWQRGTADAFMGPVQITPYNCHRLVLAAFIVASKFQQDQYFPMTYYAVVGGVPVAALCMMEMALLNLLDFALFVESIVFQAATWLLPKALSARLPTPRTAISQPISARSIVSPPQLHLAPASDASLVSRCTSEVDLFDRSDDMLSTTMARVSLTSMDQVAAVHYQAPPAAAALPAQPQHPQP